MTCHFWQVQNPRRSARFPASPDRRERVFLQNCPVGKQEQSVAVFQLGTGFKERIHSHGTRRHRKDTETMDAKMSLVDPLRPGCFVGKEFANKRSLGKSPAPDRHGAPVGFKEKMHPQGLCVLIRVFQGEYPVGDDAELNTVLCLYTPLEWLMFRTKRKLVFVEESNAVVFPASEFEGHHYVGNQKCVFKEHPAHGLIFFIPRDRPRDNAEFLVQKCPGLVTQTIHDMLASAPVVILELGPRAFQISVVVEEFQPPRYLLGAGPKQGVDLMGTKKTMPVNEPEDVAVAFRESHEHDCGSAFESGKAGCHSGTLPKVRETKKTGPFAF
jgi:hypothetical protein